VLALLTPAYARGGSVRARVGQPAEVAKVLLGR